MELHIQLKLHVNGFNVSGVGFFFSIQEFVLPISKYVFREAHYCCNVTDFIDERPSHRVEVPICKTICSCHM